MKLSLKFVMTSRPSTSVFGSFLWSIGGHKRTCSARHASSSPCSIFGLRLRCRTSSLGCTLYGERKGERECELDHIEGGKSAEEDNQLISSHLVFQVARESVLQLYTSTTPIDGGDSIEMVHRYGQLTVIKECLQFCQSTIQSPNHFEHIKISPLHVTFFATFSQYMLGCTLLSNHFSLGRFPGKTSENRENQFHPEQQCQIVCHLVVKNLIE